MDCEDYGGSWFFLFVVGDGDVVVGCDVLCWWEVWEY